jgi:hypothetical protein
MKSLQTEVVDDNVEKSAAIQKHIRRRPLVAIGASPFGIIEAIWACVAFRRAWYLGGEHLPGCRPRKRHSSAQRHRIDGRPARDSLLQNLALTTKRVPDCGRDGPDPS